VDVNLYAYGHNSTGLTGCVENTQVGEFVAHTMVSLLSLSLSLSLSLADAMTTDIHPLMYSAGPQSRW